MHISFTPQMHFQYIYLCTLFSTAIHNGISLVRIYIRTESLPHTCEFQIHKIWQRSLLSPASVISALILN